MLTVVLAVGDEIDGRESFGEIVPGRFALDTLVGRFFKVP